MSAWLATDNRPKKFTLAIGAVVVASIFYALTLKFQFFGEKTVIAIDDVGEAAAAATAAVACFWASRRAGETSRLGWTLMGISTGLWAAGQVAWSVYEVGLGVAVPSPGLPDVGFLAAVPFAVAGIRSFWGSARGTSSRWRVWFDGLIVSIALVSTAWGFGLRLVWGTDSDLASRLFALSYPIGDILIGTVLILAIRRAVGQQKGRMALLLCGVAAYSLADSAFAYLNAEGAYGAVGSVLNTGWFAGFLLIALAAAYPQAPAKAVAQQTALDLWQLALPWMTLLTAAGGDFYTAVTGHEGGLFQVSMTAILAVLLTVNMVFERREFLDMLTEMREAHATLEREFTAGLTGIRRFARTIRDAERIEADEVRRVAGEIHSEAERLHLLVEGILDTDVEGIEEEEQGAVPAVAVAVAQSAR